VLGTPSPGVAWAVAAVIRTATPARTAVPTASLSILLPLFRWSKPSWSGVDSVGPAYLTLLVALCRMASIHAGCYCLCCRCASTVCKQRIAGVAMALSERDLRTMVSITATPGDADTDDPLPVSVLYGLRELIPCDRLSFVMFDARRHEVLMSQELGEFPVFDEREEEAVEATFWRLYWDSSCCYPDVTGDLDRITTISDFYSDREHHSSAMYCEYDRIFGVEREMMVCLPSQVSQVVRLLFSRGKGPDFSQRDRDVCTLLRPHLDRIYRQQQRFHHPIPRLTGRQWELLRLVAAGHTNGQISRRLSIAEVTVRKHLENIFERLQVTSRTAAVSRAFNNDHPIRGCCIDGSLVATARASASGQIARASSGNAAATRSARVASTAIS
jgi:DNA-binding CsgD family transcriptional regulator